MDRPTFSQGPLSVGAIFRSGTTFGQGPLLVWTHFWSGPTLGQGPLMVVTRDAKIPGFSICLGPGIF